MTRRTPAEGRGPGDSLGSVFGSEGTNRGVPGWWFPSTGEIVDKAVAKFEDGPSFACSHIREQRGGSVGFLCIPHPALGVMCPLCLRLHTARHDVIAEHRCDICHDIDARIQSLLWVIDGFSPVRSPRGDTGLLVGKIFAVGLGACSRCVRRARKETAA